MLLREMPLDYSFCCSRATITKGSARSSYSIDRPVEPLRLNGLTTIDARYSSGTFDLICSCIRSADELRNWVPRPSSGNGSSSLPTESPSLIATSPIFKRCDAVRSVRPKFIAHEHDSRAGIEMKEYGLIIIGSGAGMNIVDLPLQRGERVAVVEEGPLGGTCLNRGCIPSKVLIHVADVVREAEAAAPIGVRLKLEGVDYKLVKKRMWDIVLNGRHEMEEGAKHAHGLDLYATSGASCPTTRCRSGTRPSRHPR